MEKIGVIQIVVILGIIVLKFGVIIGAALYVKRNNEKKKRLFLEQEAQRMAKARTVAENQ
jgi:hypothetical protein